MTVARYWDDGHMDGGWGVLMVLTMIALWGLLVFAAVWLVRATRTPTPPPPPAATPQGPSGPEQVLADRLARGEIDPEDYQARLAALRSSR